MRRALGGIPAFLHAFLTLAGATVQAASCWAVLQASVPDCRLPPESQHMAIVHGPWHMQMQPSHHSVSAGARRNRHVPASSPLAPAKQQYACHQPLLAQYTAASHAHSLASLPRLYPIPLIGDCATASQSPTARLLRYPPPATSCSAAARTAAQGPLPAPHRSTDHLKSETWKSKPINRPTSHHARRSAR